LLVRCVVHATRELRADDHLAVMLAAEPGETIPQLTVGGSAACDAGGHGVPVTRSSSPYLGRRDAARLVELLARLVISYFLAPSDHVDFGDPTRPAFIRQFVLPSIDTVALHQPSSLDLTRP
jgi:hypothetical protein